MNTFLFLMKFCHYKLYFLYILYIFLSKYRFKNQRFFHLSEYNDIKYILLFLNYKNFQKFNAKYEKRYVET